MLNNYIWLGCLNFTVKFLKCGDFLNVCRLETTNSSHCLLEKPLIKGARMDIAGGNVPGFTQILCASKFVTLKRLVNVAGPELSDINGVAAFLG